jgi:multidrug efflux system membrane fusion protein
MNDENRYPDPGVATATRDRRAWWAPLRTRRVLVIAAVLLAFALLAWWLTPRKTTAPAGGAFAAGGPMPIVAASAHSGDMPITLIGLGAVTPLATVTVQSQISGQIVHIAFKEGQRVKAGDPLIQIDPRPYQVALEQAQGALARDRALLDNARTDLERYQTLWAQDSIAEQQLATQRALVAQEEGNVKTDQGQIDAAKLNLTYCHITSPIDGRVGLQQVNVGNYVTPAEPNGLVVITQLQPMSVVFTLPEDNVPAILRQVHAGKTLITSAFDRTDTHLLATGALQSVDSEIDPTTGTIRLKAIFPNTDEALFPQQFVNVSLLLDTLHGATLVSQAAIQRGAPGTYVYVVKADQTVSVRKVTLGPGNATDIAVTQGLAPGDLVVVDGADRLREGAKVLVRSGAGATPSGSGAAASGAAAGAADGQGAHPHPSAGQSGRRPPRSAPGGG